MTLLLVIVCSAALVSAGHADRIDPISRSEDVQEDIEEQDEQDGTGHRDDNFAQHMWELSKHGKIDGMIPRSTFHNMIEELNEKLGK